MKKFILFFVVLLASGATSFSQVKKSVDKEKIKNEIEAVELSFQKDLAGSGAAFAFHKYAADNAVIKRENDTLVIGRQAIHQYYSNPMYQNAIAEWKPDYIDVSDDGSMAYTYGRYKWSFKDKDGKVNSFSGVFHTVWKRAGGTWKYVWD